MSTRADALDLGEAALALFRVDLKKAINPLDPKGFARLVLRFRKELQGLAGPAEALAMRRALEALDIDFTGASAAKRTAVMRAANEALRDSPLKILPKLEAKLEQEFEFMQGAVRGRVKATYGLDVSTTTSLVDEEVAKKAASAQSHYIRNEFGVRAEKASSVARNVVAKGLEDGLGRHEIAAALQEALTTYGVNRSNAYWNMISSVYAGRARQFASLSAYTEGGVDEFQFEAVLDEVTTLQCRFMHGRKFPVAHALQKYADVEKSGPESVVDLQPWMRTGTDDDGNQFLYVKANGRSERIANVTESAYGKSDEVGSFHAKVTDARLANIGCTSPPLHGNCRSTIIPVV